MLVRTLALFCAFFVSLSSLAAQDTSTVPPLHQGFSDQLVLYAELDLTGGLQSFYDVDGWKAAGGVGFAYEDFSALLRQLDIAVTPEVLRRVVGNSKKLGAALIDVGIDGDVTWMLVLEHESPEDVLSVLSNVAESKLISFKEVGETNGVMVHNLQFPTSWSDAINPFAFNRRGWGWNNGELPESYTDPISVAVWDSRYLIIGARENAVKDAIDFYSYADDPDMTLEGSRRFRDAYASAEDQDVFFYWDIPETLRKVDRVVAKMTRERGGSNEWDVAKSIGEFKQFEFLSFVGSYDSERGNFASQICVQYRNKPSWIEIVEFDPTPTALTDFVPQRPSLFASASIDRPADVLSRLKSFVSKKGEAVGKPELGVTFERALKEAAEELGFPVMDLLNQFGSSQAMFSLSPYDEHGTRRRGGGVALIQDVESEAEAHRFIQEVLARSEDEMIRKMTFHTSDREFLEFSGGKRVGYAVFNSMDTASYAFCILDGHVIWGNQDAVVASIHAKVEGMNLSNDQRYTSWRSRLPERALMTSYNDMGYLSVNADKVAPTFGAGQTEEYDDWGNRILVDTDDQQSDEQPGVDIFEEHFDALRTGSTLNFEEKRIVLDGYTAGLPTAADITDIVLVLIGYSNRSDAKKQLGEQLYPEVLRFVLTTGDLPSNPEEFAQQGGDITLMRDPSLAGESIELPSADETFVWLGRHEGQELLPALPLCHTRDPNPKGRYLLLMSDGSVHQLTREELDQALEAERKGEEPPYRSDEAQTLDQVGESLLPLCR